MAETTSLSWIPFYTEFADKLLSYRGDRHSLIELFKGVFSRLSMKFPKVESDDSVIDLDPFTVYGFFNKGITDTNRKRIIAELKKDLGIAADIPEDFVGILTVTNKSATFFYFLRDGRGESDIDNLWAVFEAALAYDAGTSDERKSRFTVAFDIAEQQHGVKWNLTMGLYWCRPQRFLSLDSRNRWFMGYPDQFPQAIMDEFQNLQSVPSGAEYLHLCKLTSDALSEGDYPYKSIPEFSMEAWIASEELKKQQKEEAKAEALRKKQEEESWWPTADEYDPGIGKDDWVKYLSNGTLSDNMLAMLKRMKDIGGAATCSQLSIKYGENFNFYLANGPSAAERIANASGCPLMPGRGKGNKNRLWPVLFIGKKAPEKTPGTFIWKLRSELDAALEEVDLSRIPLYSEKAEAESGESDMTLAGEEDGFDETGFPSNELVRGDVIPLYGKDEFLHDVYMREADMDALVAQLRRKKNVILQGAPGTGKTFAAKRLAYMMMGACDDSRIKMVQFHQNTAYDDFVCGYRPVEGGGYEACSGVFVQFCRTAAADIDNDYFFIIDEINRANISKVFGELLMLIEKDHRDDRLTLSLTGESFFVPHNVFIIGMMNTADRGLALIDYALRRRFAFFEMKPALEDPAFRASVEEMGGVKLLALVDAVQELNEAIASDPALGRGFRIGHSYFCDDGSGENVAQAIIRYEIAPLLEEYWFDDPSRAEAEVRRLMDAVRDADE